MTRTGKQLIHHEDGRVTVEEVDVPDPASDQILVRVTCSQVSAGSEMNGVRKRRSATAEERRNFQPSGMGYTAIGRVEEVGSAISGFKAGQRVLCGGQHGTHWLVTPSKARDQVSSFRHYMIEKVPEGISDTEATFAILGDVALHGVRKARIQIGESVAVHGLGVVGNLAVQLCRLSGAYPTIGVDLVEERLDLACSLGATHTVHAGQEDVVQTIRNLTQLPWRWRGARPDLSPGVGAEVQLHCSSNIDIYTTLLKAAADRGRIVLVGATSGTVAIDSHELFRREIQVTGSYQTGLIEPHPYWPWSRTRNYHTILDLIARKELQVAPLVSHVVPYGQAPELYDLMMNGGQGWMSIIFAWD